MPQFNVRAAWVNKSNYQIPVYDSLITRPGGSLGAGGNKIGTIYPNEFYVTAIRDEDSKNVTYAKIYFRNSKGLQTLGYIDPEPGGISIGYEDWYEDQSHYINYNSNGYSLVSSKEEEIDGRSYRVFTVKKDVQCVNRDGGKVLSLSDGDLIATDESTTGATKVGYMVFEKVKRAGASTWHNFTSDTYGGYAFVELGLTIGTEPNNRPIW